MNLKKLIIAQGSTTGRSLTLTAEAKGNKAYVRIIGRIANWNGNNSMDFQNKVDDLLKTHTECEVYINSEGGSVFEAVEINNQLKRFEKVTVTVGSLAASAATYFIACYPTTVSMNSQIMIHKPMLGTHGNEDQIEKQLKLLKNVTQDYLSKYSKKTGKTTDEIEELWKGGDYWMSATEAKAEKFVETIDDEAEAVLTLEDTAVLEACGAPIIPEATTQKPKHKPKTNIMERDELIAFLGLDSNATDAQISAAKSAMKVDALKQRSHAEAEKTKTDNEAAKKVDALIAKGISEKKFTTEEEAQYRELAQANYDATEKVIAAMPTKEKLSAHLTPGDGADGIIARSKWTLEDYLDKDPEALETLKAENPKAAEALEAAYFGKQ